MLKDFRTKLGNALTGKGWSLNAPRVNGITIVDKFTKGLFTTDNYQQLATSGYIENTISSTCIRKTAEVIAALPFDVFIDDKNIKDMPSDRLAKSLHQVITDPNPDYGWECFIKAIVSDKMISGDYYVHPIMSELHNLEPVGIEYFRSDRVIPIQNTENLVHHYEYSNGSRREIFNRDESGRFDIIHSKMYDPIDDITGLSPLRPAGLPIDGHTQGNKWNKQILENGAKFSGIISIQDSDNSMSLSEEQLEAFDKKIKEKAYSDNGSTLLLNMPATFEKMSLTATEMDWLEGIKANAVSIATALDYPPFLLGLSDSTFSNQEEAKISLYTDSAIPKYQDILKRISSFYSRKTGRKISFEIDLDNIPALFPLMVKRADLCVKTFQGGITTLNEARSKLGLVPIDGGDDIMTDTNKVPVSMAGDIGPLS